MTTKQFLGFSIALAAMHSGLPAAELVLASNPGGFDLPTQDSPAAAWWRDSMKTRDERTAWWRESRFGMFVHWGVYSNLGNEYKGRIGGGYAEHIQRVLKIPIPEYRTEVAAKFNPVDFNADEWIRTAKEAGMGYFIITAKHHDGFAMWPTKVNDYNVMEATPWHHDPMADLRAACKKYGVKFGFYYSHAFDWGNEFAPGNDWDYENPGGDTLIGGKEWWNTMPGFMTSARKYVDQKSIPQIVELVKTYDPDIFWFDTPGKLPPSENFRILHAVRAASARVVINGRLLKDWGDYDSTCDRPADFPPHDGDWEGIPTTNESYGWNPKDNSHKPASHFIRLLAKSAARGGNTLMNIGPMGNGRFDPKDVAILKAIGAWWKVNGESIGGTTRTPLPVQAWGESTRKGNTIYLHVLDWPQDGKLVVGGLLADVTKARLLADVGGAGHGPPPQNLAVTRVGKDLVIAVPASAPDPADSVISLECAAEPQTDAARLLAANAATNTLRAFDARLEGKLEFGPGKVTDAWVKNWTRKEDAVAWPVRLNEKATFEVSMVYDAPTDIKTNKVADGDAGKEPVVPHIGAGGAYVVQIGPQTFTRKVRIGLNVEEPLGKVTLDPGSCTVRVSASEITGEELMRLRSLVLKPALD